ncbi:MAG: S1 RNA-binding domain-containing protein [Oscillospiraceae bacterium]
MEYMQEVNILPNQNLNIDYLRRAAKENEVLCSKALVYERGIGLRFNLGGYEAIMPTDEVSFLPDGTSVKEAAIVTRINKNVCFVIKSVDEGGNEPVFYISRRLAQKQAYDNYINHLRVGDIIPCCVTHIDSFGVFCDIAYGISALLPIDFISISRIQTPADRFEVGQNIYVCIKSIDPSGRIVLSHKELLGSWLENAQMFCAQSTCAGVVRSIEDYGIFIELMPNLAGLAENCEGIQVGDVVNVYIKSILPDKMKIKLVIMSTLKNTDYAVQVKYFISQGHISRWRYSTDNSVKLIETVFE